MLHRESRSDMQLLRLALSRRCNMLHMGGWQPNDIVDCIFFQTLRMHFRIDKMRCQLSIASPRRISSAICGSKCRHIVFRSKNSICSSCQQLLRAPWAPHSCDQVIRSWLPQKSFGEKRGGLNRDQLMLCNYAFATRFLSSPKTDPCNFIPPWLRVRVGMTAQQH